ncbi:TolB protein [Desulfuromusa kysingii]|uniref:TolB protein n=1 Tax=Desulfuromusa kysingii TaxID=37625 RepID=A0A1H4DDX5_9BACT|nr:Tol-Pal system beta propeller repeat protein TolB [Desulfuromusa kysingii]SEA70706.1 TolB protein [Desulfuromusa kysingii]
MKYFKANLFIILILLFLGSTAFAARIEISAPGEQTIPLAMPRLVSMGVGSVQPAVAAEFQQVLQGDLELSGLFDLVNPASFLSDAQKLGLRRTDIDFQQWRILGAETLIKGGYSVSSGQVTVELRLFDVITQRLLTGRRYTGKLADIRKIAHTFADQILLSLTGEKGPFATKIAYISKRTGHKELYLMDVDGHQSKQMTNHRSIVLNPDFSPMRKELIFTSYSKDNPDLYRKEVYTGRESRLSLKQGLNIGGRYSPDGREIAITLSKDKNSEIYLIGTDGTIHKRLTNHYSIDVDPSWSPKGNKIAFVSDRRGNPNVFIVDIRTLEVSRLTYEGKYNVTPAWSPKGDKIAFSRMVDGVFNIFTIREDGTDERQLTFGSGSKEHPRWSPDGRFLIYSVDQSGGDKSIWVMRADGTGAKRISAPRSNDSHPAWSGRW